MDYSIARQHRLQNAFQSVLLVLTMLFLLGLLGWLLAGVWGFTAAVIACIAVLLLGPNISPGLVLRMYRAQEIAPRQAQGLYQLVSELSRRAELPRAPRLFLVPSAMLNAFAVGSREASAVALSSGLLKTLNTRELAGVLAHEISHIRFNDMWIMNLADIVSRLTIVLSQIGLVLLFVLLPLLLFGFIDISLPAILVLILAPSASALLQLALSRAREYDADLGAAELTGDPQGLASALGKLERFQGGWLERVMLPGRREPNPAVLRTHPPTAERIERLLSFSANRAKSPPVARAAPDLRALQALPVLHRRPRWHMNGLWY